MDRIGPGHGKKGEVEGDGVDTGNASNEIHVNITLVSGPGKSSVNVFHAGERRLMISILGQLQTPILSKSFPQDLHGTLSSRQKWKLILRTGNCETQIYNAF
jgi:hypothetical protein